MKNLKILFALLFVLTFSHAAFSQLKYEGKVVDVIDGRTVVIELPTHNKLTAQLQFIEVPESEQMLHHIVKDHLRKLLLGKEVEFRANQMTRLKTIGQIFADGVDISQQMLRDGAAWYSAAGIEKKDLDAPENQNYQNLEAQAKQEKRGVWSIAGLKPAWEFRAEKEKANQPKEPVVVEAKQVEAPEKTMRQKKLEGYKAANAGVQMWADVTDYSAAKEAVYSSGLLTGYIAYKDLTYISTTDLDFTTPDGGNIYKAIYRFAYVSKGRAPILGEDTFEFIMLARSKDWAFAESSNLLLSADGKTFNLGKARRISRRNSFGGVNYAEEILTYPVGKAILEKVAKSKKVELRVGKYSNSFSSKYQKSIKTLLTDSSE
jgi:endonuclease YncB( thermonuclease family)